MGQLLDTIRKLVHEEKYVIGQHASERLDERGSAAKLVTVHFFDEE